MKQLIGIVLAVLVMYVWGFAYWMFNPMADAAMKQVADNAAAQEVLAETFPESGAYFVPYSDNPEEVADLQRAGPVGLVKIRVEGVEPMAPMVFIMGGVQYLIGAVLLALLLGMVARNASRFAFVLLFAITASFYTHFGEMVWFHQTLNFPLFMFVYEFGTWFLAGLILMAFVPARD